MSDRYDDKTRGAAAMQAKAVIETKMKLSHNNFFRAAKKERTMKKLISFFIITLFVFVNVADAKDVNVKGYYRKDGTYVSPHIRSAPDQYKSNNYGPSTSTDQLMNPHQRDWDNDGTQNSLDNDDDNDGIQDDNDYNPYSGTKIKNKKQSPQW